MFQLPILEILDQMKDPENPDRSLLTRVILFLYDDENTSLDQVAATLGISSSAVYARVPKGLQRSSRKEQRIEALKPKIIQLYIERSCPKEIAYDLKIPLYRVYKILREEEVHDSIKDKAKENSKHQDPK